MVVNSWEVSSHQFYLHPSDHPGMSVIYETFTGDNYISCSHSAKMALSVKNKSCFINGTLVIPDESKEKLLFEAYVRANDLVLGWIMNSIDKSIKPRLLLYIFARDME